MVLRLLFCYSTCFYMRVVWSAVFFEIGLREIALEDDVVFAMAQHQTLFGWARVQMNHSNSAIDVV